VIVGAGIGARSNGGSSPGDFAANTPSAIVALCVPGAPGCTQPTLTPGVGEVVEGDSGQTMLSVPITLDHPSSNTVTVDYVTVDATAAAPADYDQWSGTVSIPPGSTTGYANIPVNGDIVDETQLEYFLTSFRNPQHATLGGFYGLGLGVIDDDDPLPHISVQYGLATEGTADPGEIVIRLTLNTASSRKVVLPYTVIDGSATSASDYVTEAGNVVFQPGVTKRAIRITLQNDTTAEDFEWFAINFAPARRGILDVECSCAVAIIVDDD
jgi:Calx-beta domain